MTIASYACHQAFLTSLRLMHCSLKYVRFIINSNSSKTLNSSCIPPFQIYPLHQQANPLVCGHGIPGPLQYRHYHKPHLTH